MKLPQTHSFKEYGRTAYKSVIWQNSIQKCNMAEQHTKVEYGRTAYKSGIWQNSIQKWNMAEQHTKVEYFRSELQRHSNSNGIFNRGETRRYKKFVCAK
jgi:hypothetical protein